MKKSLKLIMTFFVIVVAIIIFKIPTNSYATTINQVYVGDIDEPEVGNLPDRAASTGKDYSIYGDIDWYEVDTDRYLESNERFEYGHVYRLVVWVKANQGNEFNTSGSTPNVKGYINNKGATVNKAYGEAAYEIIELTYEFDLTQVITIKLSGGAIPVIGENYPDKNSWSIPNGEHYTMGNRYRWYDVTDDQLMSSSYKTFKAGNVYELSIMFYPEEGYEFAEPGAINASLTDFSSSNYSVKVESGGSSSSTEKNRLVTFTFKRLAPDDIVISEVSLENGEFPLTGEQPDYSWSVPNGAHYSISGTVFWTSPNENNRTVYPSDTFDKGQTYFLFINLTPEDGYCFYYLLDNVTLTSISDEYFLHSAAVSDDKKSVTLWFAMTAKNSSYTVRFESYGGSQVDSQTVESEETIIRPYPDPVKDGFTFVDWYVGSRLNYVYDFSKPVTSDFTLYAKWRENINGLVEVNGKLTYYADGVIQNNYTGLVEHEGEWYYVQNGIVEGNINGLTEINGIQYYLENSIVQKNYTGLVEFEDNWFYIQQGELKWGVETLVQYNGTWYYVNNSTLDWNYTGLCEYYGTEYYIQKGTLNWGIDGLTNIGGTWYYLKNSSLQSKYTGLVQYNGTWYYISNGVLDWNYTGLCEYYGTEYYIQKGTLHWGVDGLTYINGTWYYLKNSSLQNKYTGLVEYNKSWYYVQEGVLNWGVKTLVQYNGTWYYVSNSTLDWNYTGLVEYNSKWYYVQKGVLKWGVKTLVQYYGTWYYVSNSTLDWNYTGLVQYNNSWYYVQKGVLKWGIRTLVQYYGTWYYVKNSTLDWNFTGLCEYNGTEYYIQKGVLKWGYDGDIVYNGNTYHIKNSMVVK